MWVKKGIRLNWQLLNYLPSTVIFILFQKQTFKVDILSVSQIRKLSERFIDLLNTIHGGAGIQPRPSDFKNHAPSTIPYCVHGKITVLS